MTTEKELFRRVLVPLDFTDANERALAAVGQLAATRRTLVALLHVVEVVQNIAFEELEDFYRGLEEKAKKKLEDVAARLKAQGIEVKSDVAFGRRDREILRFASEFGADLIVLSSHPFDPESPAGSWGTISYKVGLVSPCPVLLMR